MALDQLCPVRTRRSAQKLDGIDLVREAVRLVFQELIESEISSAIGAGL